MNETQNNGIYVNITDKMREDFVTSLLTFTGDSEDIVRKKDLQKGFAQWLSDEHGRYSADLHPREAAKLYSLMEEILGPITESVDANGHRIFVGLVLAIPMSKSTTVVLEPNIELPQHLSWKPTGERLGSGGQGHVYLVTNREDNDDTKYALKILRNPATPQAHRRFRREIEAIQNINHHSIIQIYDYPKEDGDFQYYVMEYQHGARSLDSVIVSEHTNPFHGNTLLSLDLFEQIIGAIDACQKNEPKITHRDINPENILLLKDGSIRLIDFGICHFENGETITLTDENVGRRNYTAPECESGGTPVEGVHSDFYSASKTLWSVITSRRAFSREESAFRENSMHALFPNIPETWHLQRIFERSIRKDPANRFRRTEDALELLAELRYKINRKLPTPEIAHTRCPSCGGKYFSELPGTEDVFGSPHHREFKVVQCNSCGFVILRNHAIWQQAREARSRFQ